MRQTRLLLAGMAAPAVYLATVLVGGWITPGYNHLHQPVSALFETGAPYALPISLAFVGYNLLLIAFGIAALLLSRHRSALQALASVMILLNGLCGLVIELAPMDPMGAPATMLGTAHLVIAGMLVLTCALAMALMALGWRHEPTRDRFVPVTCLLLVVMLATGAVAAVAAAQSWPWLGLFQRLTIGSYLVWLVLLALAAKKRASAG